MTNVEFLQGLVKVFGQVSVKDMMSLIFDKYNELSEQEQKEFCSWLAGLNPKEKRNVNIAIIVMNTMNFKIKKLMHLYVTIMLQRY